MNIIHNEPDSISKLALTPRRQTPEMAYLEWSEDSKDILKPFYIIGIIFCVMVLVSILVHFS